MSTENQITLGYLANSLQTDGDCKADYLKAQGEHFHTAAELPLSDSEIFRAGYAAGMVRQERYCLQATPGAIGITAVAVTKNNDDGELYLDWLLEGGICELEHPGVVLLATDGANLTGDDGRGEVYTLPQQAGYMTGVPLLSTAAQDVLAERNRQITAEGWTPEHDDEHDGGEMAAAGAAYALHAADYLNPHSQGDGGDEAPDCWPWHDGIAGRGEGPEKTKPAWWKPGAPRRNLVKAGALILAEIERLDRANAPLPEHPLGIDSEGGSHD